MGPNSSLENQGESSQADIVEIKLDTRPSSSQQFADAPTISPNGEFIWKQQEWLPIASQDLPFFDGNHTAENYTNIINFFNVDDSLNARYATDGSTTYCNIFLSDVTAAMHVPIPRWINGEKTYANMIYDWLQNPDQGAALGWELVSAEEAQDLANQGFPVVAAAKWPNYHGHVALIIPGSGETINSVFYPNSAQAGRENFVGRNVYSGFNRIIDDGYGVKYFVNRGPGYNFVNPDQSNQDLPDYSILTSN